MSKFKKTEYPNELGAAYEASSVSKNSGRDATVNVLRKLLDEEIARNRKLEEEQHSSAELMGEARLADLAARNLRERRIRRRYFSPSLFGEPGWEMLVRLFVSDSIERRVTTTRLAELAGAALTTALRWIDYLEAAKLIERQADVHDRRLVWVVLTDRGRDLLTSYFTEIQ